MKTFEQFQLDSQQLDEGLGTLAKVAVKSAVKLAKKGGLKKVGKKVGKLFKKKPRRTIDPFFADKAVERGTMVRGYHGQSAKNIAQYKKTGVPPTVSGLNPSTSGYNKATQDWMKRTGYQGTTKMARPGKDAYFATATDMGKKQATKYKGTARSQNMARPGVDAYFADATKEGKKRAGQYAKRGAAYENQKLKNVLNPRKDKGKVMDVVVNKRSVRKGWKGTDGKYDNPGDASERIAKAQDIIPVVPGPSAKIAKYRLSKLKRTKHQRLNKKNNIE